MRILYILEDGRLGGMSKMTLDIAQRINSPENRVRIVVAKENSLPLLSTYKNSGLEINTISLNFLSKRSIELVKFFFYFIPDILSLISEIRKFSPNLVYCNGAQSIKGAIAARIVGKRVIWHMHDTYQPRPVLLLFKIIKSLFGINHFVASSKRTIEFYNLPKENTLLSIPPVDCHYFTPQNKTLIKNRNKYQITTVANVNPDKGIDTLIEIAAKINKERNDVQFNIIGLIPNTQNSLFSKLSTLISTLKVDNVTFMGQRDNIKEILLESDLYLCTSNNESGPISVFEAMAMKVPVVSTDVGDLREIFNLNNSGTVQPVKDSDALAKEILYLLSSPEELEKRRENGRRTALQYLDIKHSISKHIKFYEQVILD